MLGLRLRSLFRRKALESELDDELKFHLEKQVDEYIAVGMHPREARKAALRLFGGLERHAEECRDTRRINMMEDLIRDLGYAMRVLRKSPGFTVVAVLSLALGIGANTAIFSIINPLLLRPLSARQPERLVRILTGTIHHAPERDASYPNYVEIRKSARSLESVAACSWGVPVGLGAAAGAKSESLMAFMVSGNFFSTLGVQAALGRTFLPEEDRTRGDHPVVVVSHQLWKERFGSDPKLPGKTVMLGGRPFDVVGVAPANMPQVDPLTVPDLWIPLAIQAQVMNYQKLDTPDTWLTLIGRLAPGVTLPQAQAELSAIAARLAKDQPKENRERVFAVLTEREGRSPVPGLVEFAWVFLGVTGFVLLLACANLAGLQFARSSARAKEISIRFAIGASKKRVFSQLLTESLLVALVGGVGGLIAGQAASWLIVHTLPQVGMRFVVDTGMDWRVIAFTASAAILSGVLFGTLPAIRSLSIAPIAGIKEASARRRVFGSMTAQGILAAGQMAITCLLLVGAGLLLRSLLNAGKLELGFDPRNRVVATVNPSMQGYNDERSVLFCDKVMRRIAAMPGVVSVSSSITLPLGGPYLGDTNAYIEGETPIPDYQRTTIYYDRVSANFFQTMGTPVLRGRDFTERDVRSANPLAVVNQAFADAYWPGQDPIGKRFRLFKPSEKLIEIVGVVPNGKYQYLSDNQRHVYLTAPGNGTLVIHTAGNPAAIEKMLPAVIAEVDPDVPVTNIKTMGQQIGFAYYPVRVAASMMSILGVLAVLVAAIGVYGMFAFHVRRRTKEFGIRLAIGARPGSLMSLIFRQAAVLIAIGLVAGQGGALLLGRLLVSVLYGLPANDPITFLSAGGLLTAAALAAICVPALRAARVDPLAALREE